MAKSRTKAAAAASGDTVSAAVRKALNTPGEPNACSDPPCHVETDKETGRRIEAKTHVCERHQLAACADPPCDTGRPCTKHK